MKMANMRGTRAGPPPCCKPQDRPQVRRQVLEQQLLNGRDALDECRADRIGHFAVLVALRHRQRDLARQLFVDVLHQKRAVLLRRQLQEVAVAVVNREMSF